MRCLFCKENSSFAKSIEHIIPESLGNKTFTLPRGYVCDKCNNYLAREVEKPFLEREDMRLLRFQEDIPSKKNKFPQLIGNWCGIPVEVKKEIHNGEIVPRIGMLPELFKKLILHPQENYQMILPAYTDALLPPQDVITSRFIGKIAVEALAHKLNSLDDGLDQLIDDKQFDSIRNHVRRGSPKSWPCHIRRIYSHHKSWVDCNGESYQIIHESDFLMPGITEYNGSDPVQAELYFVVALWGIEFAINLGGPCIEGYQTWLQEHDDASPLYYGKNTPNSTKPEVR